MKKIETGFYQIWLTDKNFDIYFRRRPYGSKNDKTIGWRIMYNGTEEDIKRIWRKEVFATEKQAEKYLLSLIKKSGFDVSISRSETKRTTYHYLVKEQKKD